MLSDGEIRLIILFLLIVSMSETTVMDVDDYRFMLDKHSLIVSRGSSYQNEFRREDISQISANMTTTSTRREGIILLVAAIVSIVVSTQVPPLKQIAYIIASTLGIIGIALLLYKKKETELSIDLIGGQEFKYKLDSDISKTSELSRKIFQS